MQTVRSIAAASQQSDDALFLAGSQTQVLTLLKVGDAYIAIVFDFDDVQPSIITLSESELLDIRE